MKLLRPKSIYNRLLKLSLLALPLIALTILSLSSLVIAASFTWTTPGQYPTAYPTNNTRPEWTHCQPAIVSIDGETSPRNACINHGINTRIGVFLDQNYWRTVVGFNGDSKMYVVNGIEGLGSLPVISSEGKDALIAKISNINNSAHFSYFKDAAQHFEKKYNDVRQRTEYNFDTTNPDLQPIYTNGVNLPIGKIAASRNGHWAIANVQGYGIIRINFQTGETRVFAAPYWQSYSPEPQLTISNDGSYGLISFGQEFRVYNILETCGTTNLEYAGSIGVPCPYTIDYGPNHAPAPGPAAYMTSFRFSEDGGELEFGYKTQPPHIQSEPAQNITTLRAHGYHPPTSLSYLALGDSFSSGEGDTERVGGNKFYRPHTDVAKNLDIGQAEEKCHVSTRSYPYVLALGMNLGINSPKQWDSVACSGAQTIDITPEDRESDRGQGNRLAELGNYSDLKATALNEMIPGRVKQLDFVKKYRPKAITLTMGGNDVGFADKMQACVTSAATCDYARESYRAKMRSEIQGMFKNLTGLYRDLASQGDPSAKIYVLGYPQFITDNPGAICTNTFWLDANERTMVVESVKYMNSIIKAAAKNAGVYYVDIAESLGEHKLCGSEKDKYVTAITGYGGFNGNDVQESFHPNAKGHDAIAKTVREGNLSNSSLLEFDPCPNSEQNRCEDPTSTLESVPVPGYFQAEGGFINVKYLRVTVGDPVAGAALAVSLKQFFFAPGLPVTVTLFSNPTLLGAFNAKDDGSLETNITLPADIPPGYHRLVLEGKSYSGEPVEYEQVVLVKSANPADIDGDSITDTQDKCRFIQPINIDADADGNDDACDPEIAGPTDPYRVRAGNPEKSYAGQPEKANYLYLERNVNATALTGVANDYDADADGWATIAASQDDTQAGPYARFWIDGDDGSKVPHLALRTKEHGCVQYKPEDLSQLTEANSSARKFTQEAADTNTCRSEPADADLDNNGQADNLQPLYLTRRGDQTKGEDANKFYLFRSTRAAEAQLGKSDYAANDTALLPPGGTISPTDTKDYRQTWSLLASAPHPYPTFPGNFTKLKFIDNYPYILPGYTALFYTNCSAYKPASLSTIKHSDQQTRPLQLDVWQTLSLQWQGGCN